LLLSVSVVAFVTVPPGTAVNAAADAELNVAPVSAVSLVLAVVVPVVLDALWTE
jgi:hypothetical protein